MKESDFMRQVMIRATNEGARVFRNQVGRYQLLDGTYISSGLCVGSSDLIGWKTVQVTPEMVGKKMAVFVAIECKSDNGRLTTEQKNFIETVLNSGGIAFVVRPSDTGALL